MRLFVQLQFKDMPRLHVLVKIAPKGTLNLASPQHSELKAASAVRHRATLAASFVSNYFLQHQVL